MMQKTQLMMKRKSFCKTFFKKSLCFSVGDKCLFSGRKMGNDLDERGKKVEHNHSNH
jgi:hypothetical protein